MQPSVYRWKQGKGGIRDISLVIYTHRSCHLFRITTKGNDCEMAGIWQAIQNECKGGGKILQPQAFVSKASTVSKTVPLPEMECCSSGSNGLCGTVVNQVLSVFSCGENGGECGVGCSRWLASAAITFSVLQEEVPKDCEDYCYAHTKEHSNGRFKGA